ncbi:LutC/YkgG family protein [Cohnella soli]|uniref:Lactate utilization protein C n=1 Tax=Cohnella soli TaxID=425005 RepID=A0ABW0HYT7_9BACL
MGIDAGKTHDEWLKEMEVRSREKQLSFISGISSKLRRPMVTSAPVHPYRGAPDFWNAFEWTEEQRIERFTDNFRNNGGHVERLASMEEAANFIADKAKALGARYVVRQDEAELASLELEQALPDTKVSTWNSDAEQTWMARSAEADVGVVMADAAAAYTSSIMVRSAAGKGRSVSLLPTVLVVIIPLERLKTRLGEILNRFDEEGRESLPAGIHFISGPSRSSDIENDLTIGVHGPGVVYALIVG